MQHQTGKATDQAFFTGKVFFNFRDRYHIPAKLHSTGRSSKQIAEVQSATADFICEPYSKVSAGGKQELLLPNSIPALLHEGPTYDTKSERTSRHWFTRSCKKLLYRSCRNQKFKLYSMKTVNVLRCSNSKHPFRRNLNQNRIG